MRQLTVMIKPASNLCNMECTYCFYHDVSLRREVSSSGIMTYETLENIVRKAFRFSDSCVSFLFQGGEPTLAGKDFFRHYLKLIREYNSNAVTVQSSIQTNGYCIDEEWANIFMKGNFLVGISLDGTEAIHNKYRITHSGSSTYHQVKSTIRLLKKNQINYNVLCVVTKELSLYPAEVFHALKEHYYIQFIPCMDSFDNVLCDFSLDSTQYGNFLIKLYDLYEQEIYQNNYISIRTFDNWMSILLGQQPENCAMMGICGIYYVIEADGSVYPCDFYCLDQWKLGDINKTSFYRLEKSELALKFRESSLPINPNCRSCPWFSLCRGGCRRDRQITLNHSLSENRLCRGHQIFFDARINQMIKLAGYIATLAN